MQYLEREARIHLSATLQSRTSPAVSLYRISGPFMESYSILYAELQSLSTIPRDLATAAASESQARREIADNERRLEEAKKATDNAILGLEATSKMSRRVSGLLTGKSREYKREAELADKLRC